MQAVLNSALPIFALILSGYLCAKFKVLGEDAAQSLNGFTVYLALPALLFSAMTKVTPEQFGQAGFAAALGSGIAVTYALAFAVSFSVKGELAPAALTGLNASYANVGYMGIPLCFLLFGQQGLAPAIIATLFTACIAFAITIVFIETGLNPRGNRLQTSVKVLALIARNPLIVSSIAGIAVGLSGFTLPVSLERYVSLMSGAASPCALVSIGLFLAQDTDGHESWLVAVLVALKLFVQPAITAFLVLFVFTMPKVWASAAILLSALPTGTGPFILAKLYNVEPATTSRVILVSHVLSVLTISAFVAVLA